jgi:hypothetical protein
MSPKVVSVERWVADRSGGHWSSVPIAKRSRGLLRPANHLLAQMRTHLAYLRSLLARIGVLFFQPQHLSISVPSACAGDNGYTWPLACSEDMKQQLGQSPWIDPLDHRVWTQAWICGAQWAHRTSCNALPVQTEDSPLTSFSCHASDAASNAP